MAESKHTRGQWVLDPPGSLRIGSGFAVKARTPEGPGFPTPSATGFYVIAEPPPHGRDKAAEQEANARLIAAAPDMLAALKAVEDVVCNGWTGEAAAHADRMVAAAIAKAEAK